MAGEIEPPAGMREFLVNRAAQITSEVGASLSASGGDPDPQQLKEANKRLKEARRALRVARDISVNVPVDLPVGVEIALPSQEEPAADPTPEKSKSKRPSIGSVQRTLVDAALRVNEEGDGFLFENVLTHSATKEIFPERVAKYDELPSNLKYKKIRSLTGSFYQSFKSIIGRLRALDNPDSVDRDGKIYLTEIRASHPRFANLSAGEITDLLERKIPFPGSTPNEQAAEEPEAQDETQIELDVSSQPTFSDSSPGIPDTRKRKINYPIGKEQADLGIQLLLPNSSGTDFLHTRDKFLKGKSNNVKKLLLKALTRRMLQQPNNPHVIRYMEEIRTLHPRYANLSIHEAVALMQRTIPFNHEDKPGQEATPVLPTNKPEPEIKWKKVRVLPPAVPRPLPQKPRIQDSRRVNLPPPNHLNGKSHKITVEQDVELTTIPNPNLPKSFAYLSKGELAAYLLLQLNPSRTGFKYQTAEEAINKFPIDYQQAIDGLAPDKKKAFQKNYSEFDVVTLSTAFFADQLRRYDIDDVTAREPNDPLSNFLNWANKNRALETFTPKELANLIQRRTPFKAIPEAYFENPKYGSFQVDKDTVIKRRIPDFDLFRLKKIAGTIPPEIIRRGEITIPEEFITISNEIISQEQTNEDLRNGIRLSTGTLLRRLRAFFANPASYYAQVSDPNEILILKCLEGLAKKPVTRELFLKMASC